ncbi:hypothetical protein MTO96_006555 [Rhipicephalus appendiculatus]
MTAGPLIIDRLCKNISNIAASKGRLCKALLEYAVELQDLMVRNAASTRRCWTVSSSTVCGAYWARGSGSLSAARRRYLREHAALPRACLCCNVIETYGTPETCAVAAIQDIEDKNMGRVGAAVPGTYVRPDRLARGVLLRHRQTQPSR